MRAVDQHGVVLDILVQERRNAAAAERFSTRLLQRPALQTATCNPAKWSLGRKPRKRCSLAGVGQQCIQSLAHTRIQPICDAAKRSVVIGCAFRVQNTVKPITTEPTDPLAREPATDLAFEDRRRGLLRQQFARKPASELRLRHLIEGGDREMIENKPPMSAPRAPGPLITFKSIRMDAELGGEMPDNRRSEIGFLIGKPSVLPPIGVAAKKCADCTLSANGTGTWVRRPESRAWL
jgi:hypothetical protein